MVFKTLDFQGKLVSLSNQTWFKKLLDPIFGHPEVKPYLNQIKDTLRNPDYVYQSLRDPRSKLFYGKIKSGKFKLYFLVVVVKYPKEETGTVGYVSTAMINRELPKKGKLLWIRNST